MTARTLTRRVTSALLTSGVVAAMAFTATPAQAAAPTPVGPAQFQTHDGINVLVRQTCSEDKKAGINVLTRATVNHGSKYIATASAGVKYGSATTTILKRDVPQLNRLTTTNNTRPATMLRVALTKASPNADQSKNTVLEFPVQRINCVKGTLLPDNRN